MKTYQFPLAAVVTLIIGASEALALDTDVYLKSQALERDDTPNVVIVLDNSGSMATVLQSAPDYDPTIDYCTADLNALYPGMVDPNSGKPSTCATGGRIYWAFGTTPPDTTSSDWFTDDASHSRNKCVHSWSALSGSSGSNGFFTSSMARWKSGSGWQSFVSGSTPEADITYVDCSADDERRRTNSTADGLVVNDGKYPLAATPGLTTAYGTSGTDFNYTSSMNMTLYTANYLNYWHNAKLSQDTTRMSTAKYAAKAVIDANAEIRFGLMIFNRNSGDSSSSQNGGRVIFKADTMDDARRTQMKHVIDTIQPEGNTPLAETMWEAYSYLSGTAVDYGNDNPIRSVSSMTLSGSTVTVRTSTSHAFPDGAYVTISGATQPEYNGNFVITDIDSDEFSYTISGTPVSPATGTITATLYRDTSAESGANYISPFAFACQKAYVIYITDGDPTQDQAADSKIETRIGENCDGSNCLDDLAEWMSKNDVYSGLPESQSVVTYTVGFGTGISSSGKALLQDTATSSGGEYKDAVDAAQLVSALQSVFAQILEKTTSFTSPSLSVNAFNRLYNREEIYLALFKPTDSCRWDGNVKKYKLCTSADIAAGVNCEFGDLLDETPKKATDINHQIRDDARSYWSSAADGSDVNKGGAGEEVPAAASRAIWTFTGDDSGLSASSPGTPVPLVKPTSGTNAFYSAVTADPTLLGLPSSSTTADVDKLIDWIRGLDAYDQRRDGPGDTAGTHTGVTNEPRAWMMGDVVHSRPVAINYGGSAAAPIIKLFFGTNDGMIRMIRHDTGQEQWAFMPQEMYGMQYKLSQGADGDHLWGMDNTLTFWVIDANKNGIIEPSNDKVYMFASMRRGGRNIYAFDVTPSSAMTGNNDTVTPKLMWVIKGGSGDFAQLGQTWSRPLVTRVRVKCSTSACDDGDGATADSESRIVLLFAGGYDIDQDANIPAGPDDMGNAIYMVDPLTGERLWWASSDTSAMLVLDKMRFAIPSDLALYDSDGDNATDRIYVGDMGGQLWRIDLSNQMDMTSASNSARNGGTAAYVFADVGCGSGATHDSSASCPSSTVAQQRRKFFYPPDIAPVKDLQFSTEPNYDAVAIGSGDREDPLDFLTSNLETPASKEAVHNRIYLFRDYNYIKGAPATAPAPLTESVLYDATDNAIATATGAAFSDAVNDLKAAQGWFIDLQGTSAILIPNGLTTTWVGEKVLATAAILDGVVNMTTFTPANDTNSTTTCKPQEGVAQVYALDIFTAIGVIDYDNDGTKDRAKQVGGGIPSEVVPIYLPDGQLNKVQTSSTPVDAGVPPEKQLRRTSWKECADRPDAAAEKLCGE